MTKVIQYELKEVTKEPNVRLMVTWIDAKHDIDVGNLLTLQGIENTWWEVTGKGQPHERSDIKRGWGMTDYMGKEKDRT